jgi:archaellum component FlaC
MPDKKDILAMAEEAINKQDRIGELLIQITDAISDVRQEMNGVTQQMQDVTQQLEELNKDMRM